jgi:hypothetical protein
MRALLGFSSNAVLHMRIRAALRAVRCSTRTFPSPLGLRYLLSSTVEVDLGIVMLHSGGRILYAYAAARTC